MFICLLKKCKSWSALIVILFAEYNVIWIWLFLLQTKMFDTDLKFLVLSVLTFISEVHFANYRKRLTDAELNFVIHELTLTPFICIKEMKKNTYGVYWIYSLTCGIIINSEAKVCTFHILKLCVKILFFFTTIIRQEHLTHI